MIKVTLSILMIILILLLIYILSKKYKLNKKQQMIFWILVLFWSSVSIIRAYRKIYALDSSDIGGLGLNVNMAIQITAAYGLISFLIRFPLFLFSDMIEKKKIFIQIAMLFIIISSFLVFINPSYYTLYISSISMGFCASMLAIFNLIFSETFTKENTAISASILSTAPLLAEFIAAPIQYLATYNSIKNYKYLWLISSLIGIITLILTLKLNDIKVNKKEVTYNKLKIVFSNKFFIFICFVAFLQSVVKFSTSGPNMIAYNKSFLNMNPALLAFSDTMFALPQLIASILVGTFFVKKIGLEKTLRLGIFLSAIFFILMLITNNQYTSFISYTFNGFGYGLIYISLISISMQYFDYNIRNVSMAVFQLFFSAGIFYGDNIYKIILFINPNNPKFIFQIVSFISIINIISLSIFFKYKK